MKLKFFKMNSIWIILAVLNVNSIIIIKLLISINEICNLFSVKSFLIFSARTTVQRTNRNIKQSIDSGEDLNGMRIILPNFN
jgi:hypothetical protein